VFDDPLVPSFHFISTMSGIAPFVAAALRDRTVQELIDENRRLRAEHDNMYKQEKETVKIVSEQVNGVDRVHFSRPLRDARQGVSCFLRDIAVPVWEFNVPEPQETGMNSVILNSKSVVHVADP
jgi:hypothetical protein